MRHNSEATTPTRLFPIYMGGRFVCLSVCFSRDSHAFVEETDLLVIARQTAIKSVRNKTTDMGELDANQDSLTQKPKNRQTSAENKETSKQNKQTKQQQQQRNCCMQTRTYVT